MNNLPKIDNIKFHSVREKDSSFIGFITFTFGDNLVFNQCFLHKRKNGLPKYRVVYPESKFGQAYACPINKELQMHIDTEISSYLIAQKII